MLLLEARLSVAAYEFEVEGTISIIHYDSQGKAVEPGFPDQTFKMSVNNGSWLLNVSDVNGASHISSSDGTNTYWLFLSTNTAGIRVPAVVVKGIYPLAANNVLVTLPWWAFASSAALSVEDNTKSNFYPVPWAFPRVDPESYIYSHEVKLSEPEPRLPDEILFRVSSELLKAAPGSVLLDSSPLEKSILDLKKQNLSWFKPNFIGGEYKVSQHTNWNQLALPAKAELIRYSVIGGSPLEQYILTTRSVSHAGISSFVPDLKWAISVTDQRFRNKQAGIDSISYPISDGKWRSDDDSELQKAFQRKIGVAVGNQPFLPRPSTTTAVRLLLAFVIVLPVVFVLFKKLAKPKTSP